jgi:hypothetical protein
LCQPALEGGIEALDFGSFLRPKFAPPEGRYPVQVLRHAPPCIGLVRFRFRHVPRRRRSFFEGF